MRRVALVLIAALGATAGWAQDQGVAREGFDQDLIIVGRSKASATRAPIVADDGASDDRPIAEPSGQVVLAGAGGTPARH